ncbi:MAG: SlyX family protein [Paracoccus sp. (in: a-proteobacteria)]|uniref:SlyX family protein n=1 Tax=Paracoccus sp. TaxID=267 RepID=UPI0040585760
MDKQPDRLHQMEEALAHLARLTDDLSEVIARQDRDIARLTHRLDLLMQAEAERQADQTGTIPLADQRPPHY